MKQIIAGILAHVDAGKTTLSEALLYSSGSIKKIGRVDNGDAFLDTDAMEKKRGITIFSKQAELQFGDTKMTLLDTPGHVDFSAEMERTLMVLDYAVLVISASDGVQAHTQTLWRLLKRYEIPVFLFINKMDQPGTDRAAILLELKKQLSDGCIDFTNLSAGTEEEAQENEKRSTIMEEIAMEDETAMESFLETGRIAGEQIREMIVQRKIFPCFFGSALRNAGVDTFLQGFDRYTLAPEYPDEFGMKVFKIARDEAGSRLTYLKVTGGTLKVKSPLSNADHVRFGEEVWEQKVNQIRIYSGTKYELINEADVRRDRIRPHISGTGIWNRSAGRNTGTRAGTAFPSDPPGGSGAGSHAAKIAPDRGGRAGITYCMERKASGDPDPDHGRGPD